MTEQEGTSEEIVAKHDVFLSYRKLDADVATMLADRLEEAGITVWWDTEIRPGANWNETIEREIRASKAVVVLWTENSVGQDGTWVKNEARYGGARGALFPVMAEKVQLPIEFSHVQTADLSDWDFGSDSDVFDKWIDYLQHFLDKTSGPLGASTEEGDPVVPDRRGVRSRPRKLIRTAIVAAIAAGTIIAAGFAATRPVSEMSLDLNEMHVEGARISLDSDAQMRQIRAVEVIVYGELGSVAVRAENVTQASGVDLLAVVDPREGATAQIEGFSLDAGTVLEIQEMEGIYTLSIEAPIDWLLTLSGEWDVELDDDFDTYDFGASNSIAVSGGSTVELDFIPDLTEGPLILLEQASIRHVEFSSFDRFDPQAEAESTILAGTLDLGGSSVEEAISQSSLLGFDRYGGSISNLRVDEGGLRGDFVGASVAGARLDGRSLMPSQWEARSTVERLVGASLLLVFLWALAVGGLGWRRRRR